MKNDPTPREDRQAIGAHLPDEARRRWEDSGLADKVGPLFPLLGRLITRRVELALADAGLGMTPAQARAVATLWLHGPMSQQALATHTEVEPSTLVRTLDVMEREGIAVRERDPDDRRAHRVVLTSDGEALIPRLVRLWEEVESEIVAGLDADELARTREILGQMAARLASGGPPCCG